MALLGKNTMIILSFLILFISILLYIITANLEVSMKEYIYSKFNLTTIHESNIDKQPTNSLKPNSNDITTDLPNFGEELDPTISLRLIKDFLTDDECAHIIKLAENIYDNSYIVENNTRVLSERRTSESAI